MRWFQIRSAVWMTLVLAVLLGGATLVYQGYRAARTAYDAGQDVNQFEIVSFDADYTVHRAVNGRPSMRVVETIVVDFTHAYTNHGIERTMPTSYRGRSIGPDLVSVTDADGDEQQVSTRHVSDNVVWRIGDPDDYVTGHQTYVITYDVAYVIQTFGDHQELYWDVNGDGWLQSADTVRVTLTLADGLAEDLTGALACYVPRGSSCHIGRDGDSIVAGSGSLPRHRTLTIAVGFRAGTALDLGGTGLDAANVAQIMIIIGLVCLLLALGYALFRGWRSRTIGGDVIIATAEPPDLSPGEVAAVLNHPERIVAAELLDAAVKGHVTLFGDTTIGAELTTALKRSSFTRRQRRRDRADVSSLHYPRLSALATGALESVFGTLTSPSKVRDVKARLKRTRARELASAYIPYVKGHADGLWKAARPGKALPWLFAGTGVIMLLMGWHHVRPALLLPALGLILLAVWVSRAVAAAPVLSDDGQAAAAKIMGLRQFLVMTDTDRLRVMQAADTAERGDDDEIKVYEKLLGYAAALGVEKTWARAMGRMPASVSSDGSGATLAEPRFSWLDTSWSSLTSSLDRNDYRYRGMGLRLTNAPALFTLNSTATSFSHGVGSILSSSGGSSGGSSFSSSGGSGGGGFSGGGGGGGGGGGW